MINKGESEDDDTPWWQIFGRAWILVACTVVCLIGWFTYGK